MPVSMSESLLSSRHTSVISNAIVKGRPRVQPLIPAYSPTGDARTGGMTTSAEELSQKYQKLFQEYSRIKAQHAVLKKAVIKEQANNAQLQSEVKEKEKELRKVKEQLDLLSFHNERLTKRIEGLQEHDEKKSGSFSILGGAIKKELERHREALTATNLDLEGKIKENGQGSSFPRARAGVTYRAIPADDQLFWDLNSRYPEELHKELYDMNTVYAHRVEGLQDKVTELEKKAEDAKEDLKLAHDENKNLIASLKLDKINLEKELKKMKEDMEETARILRESHLSHGEHQLHMEIDTLRTPLSIKPGPPERILVPGEPVEADPEPFSPEGVAEDHRFKYMNVSGPWLGAILVGSHVSFVSVIGGSHFALQLFLFTGASADGRNHRVPDHGAEAARIARQGLSAFAAETAPNVPPQTVPYEQAVQLKKASEKWSEELRVLALQLDEAEGRIKRLTQEKDAATAAREQTVQRLAAAEKEVNLLREQAKLREGEAEHVVQLQKEVEELRALVEELRSREGDSERVAVLEEEVNELRDELELLQNRGDNQLLSEEAELDRIAQYERDADELRAQLEQTKADSDKLNTQLMEVLERGDAERVVVLEKEASELREQLEQLRAQEERMMLLEKEAGELRKQLEEARLQEGGDPERVVLLEKESNELREELVQLRTREKDFERVALLEKEANDLREQLEQSRPHVATLEREASELREKLEQALGREGDAERIAILEKESIELQEKLQLVQGREADSEHVAALEKESGELREQIKQLREQIEQLRGREADLERMAVLEKESNELREQIEQLRGREKDLERVAVLEKETEELREKLKESEERGNEGFEPRVAELEKEAEELREKLKESEEWDSEGNGPRVAELEKEVEELREKLKESEELREKLKESEERGGEGNGPRVAELEEEVNHLRTQLQETQAVSAMADEIERLQAEILDLQEKLRQEENVKLIKKLQAEIVNLKHQAKEHIQQRLNETPTPVSTVSTPVQSFAKPLTKPTVDIGVQSEFAVTEKAAPERREVAVEAVEAAAKKRDMAVEAVEARTETANIATETTAEIEDDVPTYPPGKNVAQVSGGYGEDELDGPEEHMVNGMNKSAEDEVCGGLVMDENVSCNRDLRLLLRYPTPQKSEIERARELLLTNHYETKIQQLTGKLQLSDSKVVRFHKTMKVMKDKLTATEDEKDTLRKEMEKLQQKIATAEVEPPGDDRVRLPEAARTHDKLHWRAPAA
ncbi:hypothetical protein BC936DRAFT_147962 [Jimgerdemannia flammicorona]|uniref:Protein phosphatase 1 regulatory subunit 21 N-terminal domain-containing protein n=1 Tax=Jimgerdemannia flammicorona TaxID=994334 RepID=A0A433D456_9FUNG|nr:hypothetical protein BC936DRAFT_147962 [Jimgerdemannia flammicorona]